MEYYKIKEKEQFFLFGFKYRELLLEFFISYLGFFLILEMNEQLQVRHALDDDHDTDSSCNQRRLAEFIHDLKDAIESGKFHNQSNNELVQELQQQQQHLDKLINVDNLSNQTFSYIINWLKQQKEKKQHDNNQDLTNFNNHNNKVP